MASMKSTKNLWQIELSKGESVLVVVSNKVSLRLKLVK